MWICKKKNKKKKESSVSTGQYSAKRENIAAIRSSIQRVCLTDYLIQRVSLTDYLIQKFAWQTIWYLIWNHWVITAYLRLNYQNMGITRTRYQKQTKQKQWEQQFEYIEARMIPAFTQCSSFFSLANDYNLIRYFRRLPSKEPAYRWQVNLHTIYMYWYNIAGSLTLFIYTF